MVLVAGDAVASQATPEFLQRANASVAIRDGDAHDGPGAPGVPAAPGPTTGAAAVPAEWVALTAGFADTAALADAALGLPPSPAAV